MLGIEICYFVSIALLLPSIVYARMRDVILFVLWSELLKLYDFLVDTTPSRHLCNAARYMYLSTHCLYGCTLVINLMCAEMSVVAYTLFTRLHSPRFLLCCLQVLLLSINTLLILLLIIIIPRPDIGIKTNALFSFSHYVLWCDTKLCAQHRSR
jgi:hypothetical protein